MCFEYPQEIKHTKHVPWEKPRVFYVADCMNLKFAKDGLYSLVFSIIDWGSKFVWSFTILDKKPESIIKCLNFVVDNRDNVPKFIKMDNGGEFSNAKI